MFAAYLRTSVWLEHKVSIEAQREIINQQIDSSEVTRYFIDKGFSGSNIDRPAFIELHEWVSSSNFNRTLYVTRYDRISRNVQNALNFLELCQQHNVEVVSVLEPIPSSLGNKQAAQGLFVQILFSLAEFSRNVIIENINNGLAQKKVEKKLLSSKVPFGYIYMNEHFLVDNEEAKIVRYIFTEYASTDIGYTRLARKLNEKRITFKGKLFKSYHIAQILKNPIYTGVVGSKSSNLDAYCSTEIEPIITQELFQLAAEKRLSRTQSKDDTRNYPLRKKIACPNCGRCLNPRRQSTKDKEYFYYVCHNEECNQLIVNAVGLEKDVLKITKNYLTNQTQLKRLIESIKSQIDRQKQLKKQEVIISEKQKEGLFNQYEKGQISSEVLKLSLQQLTKDSYTKTQFDLSDKELESRLQELLNFSNIQSQEMIWPYIDEVIIDKEKNIQEVIIYGIRIQSGSCRSISTT